MKKSLLVILLLVLLTGCNSKEESIKIKMDCNNDISVHTVKKGDVLGCELTGTKYELTINSATKDKIKIKVNKFGLTDSNNLREKKDKFEFSKDKDLTLTTQTMDYDQRVILSYES